MLGYKLITGELMTGDSRLWIYANYSDLELEQYHEMFNSIQADLRRITDVGG